MSNTQKAHIISPVITIDGPSGTGKGTITALLAKALGWHVLDSGALYRTVALMIREAQVDITDEVSVRDLLATLDIELFRPSPEQLPVVRCNGRDITAMIRTEEIGNLASAYSAYPYVREAILAAQRAFREAPGLIADGRDMGTVIFPDATLKIFLDADPNERIMRRFNELRAKGHVISLADIEKDLTERDQRDAQRAIAPLAPADDAHVIDTSGLNVEQVFAKVMAFVREFVL